MNKFVFMEFLNLYYEDIILFYIYILPPPKVRVSELLFKGNRGDVIENEYKDYGCNWVKRWDTEDTTNIKKDRLYELCGRNPEQRTGTYV